MKFLYLTLIITFFSACASSKKTGETTFGGNSEVGTILLNTAGYGTLKANAIESAEINAFNNLIFRGIPGSQYQLPMVENEQKTKKEHSAYFDELLKNKKYKAFLLSTANASDLNINLSRQKTISINVKINVNALRRDMEQNGVIRKFGM